MDQQRMGKAGGRALVLLLVFAAVCGLAWSVSTGIVQNNQRQIDLNALRSAEDAIERSRWALIVGYAAMPGFFVATGAFVLLWFSSRRGSS